MEMQNIYNSPIGLEKFQKRVKPVILFKSDKIESSKNFYTEQFRPLIDNLSEADLTRIRTQNGHPLLVKMFEYFDKHLTTEELIAEIREDFSDEKCVSVNSKEDNHSFDVEIIDYHS